MSTKDRINFLFDVIKRYDHYIATTNFKVALLMSFLVSVIIGLSFRVILATTTQENISITLIISSIFVALTVISAIITSIYLFRVVFPDTKEDKTNKSLIFFSDVANYSSGNDYSSEFQKADEERLLKDISVQTYLVADIVNEKFKYLKKAINIIIFAVLPLLVISIILLITESII